MYSFLDYPSQPERRVNCTSWYGHAYLLVDGDIICARCAHSRTLPTEAHDGFPDTSCYNWYGHKIERTGKTAYCVTCGVSRAKPSQSGSHG